MRKTFLRNAALRSLCVAVAIMMFGAVFVGQTRSDFNANYRFAQLHTWNFVNNEVHTRDRFGSNEIWDMALRENLGFQLGRLGFTHASDYPDFFVRYRLGTQERERFNIYYDWWGGGGYWPWAWPGHAYYGGWWYGHPAWGGSSTVYRTPYDESTLVVDILDGKTRDLVWRGWDRREMGDNSEKTLRKSVDKLIGKLAKDIHRDRRPTP